MNGQKQPNLVFVFADQMRATDMACAGNHDVSTPNMDRLATEGMRFRRAFANAPVCGPSRASLLTGLYPLSHGVIANDLPLREDQRTLGEIFRDAGYRTGYVGKWHLDGVPRDKWTPPGGRRHGFDYWAAYNCSHDYFRRAKYFRDSPEPVEVAGYEPVVQTDAALRFIKQGGEQPFCLFLSWGPPHDPYDLVPEQYKRMYDASELQLRPNVDPGAPATREVGGLEGVRRVYADYYAAITALDDQLGRVVSALEENGLYKDTILVFTSDHGDMLWSHGRTLKQQPWEESIGVPLLVRWPGRVPAGTISESLIGIVDLTPTLLGLCDLPGAEGQQGTDLSEVVLGKREGPPTSLLLLNVVSADGPYYRGLPEWRGVRTRRYTYARVQGGGVWLLYDNQEDPYQLRNLADDPASEDLRRLLERELSRCLAKTDDEFLTGEQHLRRLELVGDWNWRERELNPDRPRLL